MIGKHFLVYNKKDEKVKRHYTICCCMSPDSYKEYLSVIDNFFRSNVKLSLNKNILKAQPTRFLTLTIKNYVSKKGLSQNIHRMPLSDTFIVKGPLGKGLDL